MAPNIDSHQLWEGYSRTNEPEDMERIVEQFMPMVYDTANHFKGTARKNGHDYVDIVRAGAGGVIEAARDYMSDRGMDFSSYVSIRVNWAIKDYIKNGGSVKMSMPVRKYLYMLETADEDLDFSKDDLRLLNITRPLSLDRPGTNDGPDVDLYATLSEESSVFYSGNGHERTELAEAVRNNLRRLPPREREVLKLKYEYDLRTEEIGNLFGFTRAWASKAVKRALQRLGSMVRAEMEFACSF
jgi:RNA polymerase sigma factor (sigma-70 family)